MKLSAEDLTESDRRRIMEAVARVFPFVLPVHWRRVDEYANGGAWLSARGLCVMGEIEIIDGRLWIHVSVSRKDRLPDWADLRAVKNLFIGVTRRAIQNLPPESEYYNLHPFCLHLYSPFEDELLPDFRLKDGRL